jgi:hypothetical protein
MNRVWSAKLSVLSELFPKTRAVCCIRGAPWIIDSIERLVHGNVFELSGVFGFEPGKWYIRRELARRRPTDRAGLYGENPAAHRGAQVIAPLRTCECLPGGGNLTRDGGRRRPRIHPEYQ